MQACILLNVDLVAVCPSQTSVLNTNRFEIKVWLGLAAMKNRGWSPGLWKSRIQALERAGGICGYSRRAIISA